MEAITHSKKKLERIKIIYNDDVKIIDFLSDLEERNVIHALQNFIADCKGLPGCLLYSRIIDSMVVVILYKSPFAFNDPGNNLMLYADNDLHGLMVYFKNLLDNTSKDKSDINGALTDIMRTLYNEWIKIQDENTQLTFMC